VKDKDKNKKKKKKKKKKREFWVNLRSEGKFGCRRRRATRREEEEEEEERWIRLMEKKRRESVGFKKKRATRESTHNTHTHTHRDIHTHHNTRYSRLNRPVTTGGGGDRKQEEQVRRETEVKKDVASKSQPMLQIMDLTSFGLF